MGKIIADCFQFRDIFGLIFIEKSFLFVFNKTVLYFLMNVVRYFKKIISAKFFME